MIDAPFLTLTQLVGFAGFTVLVYDHFITFGDEVSPRPIWTCPLAKVYRFTGAIHLAHTTRAL